MAGVEFEGIGKPFTKEEEEAIREQALDGAVRARTGMGMNELHQQYVNAYGGDPDRVAAAMNNDIGDIVAALTGPPGDKNGTVHTIHEPSKDQL
jgi:hypothetical protein